MRARINFKFIQQLLKYFESVFFIANKSHTCITVWEQKVNENTTSLQLNMKRMFRFYNERLAICKPAAFGKLFTGKSECFKLKYIVTCWPFGYWYFMSYSRKKKSSVCWNLISRAFSKVWLHWNSWCVRLLLIFTIWISFPSLTASCFFHRVMRLYVQWKIAKQLKFPAIYLQFYGFE